MKNLVLTILISSLASCQTIVDIHDNSYLINTPDTYYKDIGDNQGPWIYDDGTSYIKIVFTITPNLCN